MVACIIALVVFGILSLFSAKYRPIAKEAFDCVFRMVTLRPCTTGLDDRIKAKLVAKTLSFAPKFAPLLNKHFKTISWIFVLVFFASTMVLSVGVYNWLAYGNCNGPDSGEFCILNPSQTGAQGYSRVGNPSQLKPVSAIGGISLGPANASVTVVEVGCYSCPYTKKIEPGVKQLLAKYVSAGGGSIRFVFKVMPVPSHPYSREAALSSICAAKQNKGWEMHEFLFRNQTQFREGMPLFYSLSDELGLYKQKFQLCISSPEANAELDSMIQEGKNSGIYATPTFFVNGEPLVGQKTFEQIDSVVSKALAKVQ
jgi:protein-disulfide isomerase